MNRLILALIAALWAVPAFAQSSISIPCGLWSDSMPVADVTLPDGWSTTADSITVEALRGRIESLERRIKALENKVYPPEWHIDFPTLKLKLKENDQ